MLTKKQTSKEAKKFTHKQTNQQTSKIALDSKLITMSTIDELTRKRAQKNG